MSSFLDTLKNRYAQFSGRARRQEFWMYILWYLIMYVVVIGLMFVNETLGGIVAALMVLGLFIPSLAVTVRRLHDVGKSGWWILIGFIPFIGAIILLFFYIKEGDAGDNEYGANPKALGS